MRRRAELFGGDDDPRFTGRTTGDERALLLGAQRATLEVKCAGLDADALARRSVPPSTLSLLGLVRHLADVERRWFRRVLAGADAPARFTSDAEPDGDFDGAVAAAGLDVAREDAWRGTVSLRWVLVHLVEEYARHNGHADLLRERIDGAVGL